MFQFATNSCFNRAYEITNKAFTKKNQTMVTWFQNSKWLAIPRWAVG
jgi:hypothetical protein